MLGRLKDLTMNRDGTQNVTITIESDMRDLFDELKENEIDITIKKYSKHRSMDMNNLCWKLIDDIAAKSKLKKSEVYRNAILDIGGVSDVVYVLDEAVDMLIRGWTHKGLGWQAVAEECDVEGYTKVTLYYGSSVFSTRQMSLLIDSLIQDANALGIPTMSQKEIDKALALWGKKVNKNE